MDQIGWLKAAVPGTNDGIVSTASPLDGVAAVAATRSDELIADIAGLVAGTMCMAAREYVSVSPQSANSPPPPKIRRRLQRQA